MMKYYSRIHNRHSIRLKNYDYSQPGFYFITICCQKRACLFGDVVSGEMVLNDAGRMIEKWYSALENKFPGIKCREMVVMPNHLHCIIQIVRANIHVRPYPIGRMVQWFKTMTTNEYIRGVKTSGWPPFAAKLWQRNYYERIIRNDQSYHTIANYIKNNPAKWDDDRFRG